jgi:DNA-binding IclR family transcriptional regulator
MASRMGQTTALPPASVHNALAQLETQGVLAKSEARGQYMFEDEHLKTWIVEVARNQPAAGAPA